MLQKRLEYGFNGYQVPPTPKAARSARRRIKKVDDKSQMCAFDLLATVAGKLLQDADNNEKNPEKIIKNTIKIEEQHIKEETPLNVNVCDQESCNRSFFVTEILSQNRVTDEVKNETFSGITVSSEKGLSGFLEKGKLPYNCKLEDKNINGKSPFVNSLENSVKFPYWKDHGPRGPSPLCQNNVNLVNRDDEENSSGCTEPRALNNKRIGDRRIRRFLASKYWNEAPKLNDEVHFDAEAELDPIERNRKNCYKRQRSLRDYPFKKRRLYELHNFSNSDGPVISDDRSSSPINDSIEDGSSFGAKERGIGKSGFSKQNIAFQSTDSHVKLKIKSFRVPELFIEIPETATVGSLKRTVMEAVNAILSGELHVGVMLQGKKIRDDNKTLLQAGIRNENSMDALSFTLESDQLQVFPTLCSEDQNFVLPSDMPKPLTRYPPPPMVTNKVVIQHEVCDDPPMTNFSNLIESDHDSAPSPPDMSVDSKSVSDSRALVTVPAMNAGPLAVVPMRKSKRAEVAQRRIRRPFSVSEVEALVQAVEKLGTGRWRDVKLRAFDNAKHRTYVDLKDKWKTLVHTARISPQQRRGEPVPQELLDRVLAAHAYWSHHQAKHHFKHQPVPQTCRLL